MIGYVLVLVIIVVFLIFITPTSRRMASRCVCAIVGYIRGYPIDEDKIQLPSFTDYNDVTLLVNGNQILPTMLEIIDRATVAPHDDSLGKLIRCMILAEVGKVIEATSEYDAALRLIEDNGPIPFNETVSGGIGPCAIDFLRSEAAALLSDRDDGELLFSPSPPRPPSS